MKRFEKQTKILFAIGILCLLISLFLLFWSISLAMLRCVYCDCSYQIFSESLYCSFPAILSLLFYFTFGISLILIIVSGLSYRKNNLSKSQTLK